MERKYKWKEYQNFRAGRTWNLEFKLLYIIDEETEDPGRWSDLPKVSDKLVSDKAGTRRDVFFQTT